MAIAASTLALIAGISKAAVAVTAIGGTVASISAQRSAAKKAKGQAEQAKRIRKQELARIEDPKKGLVAQAEALPEIAQKKAAAIAAGKKRKRSTLVTGPRGLLDEPVVKKPSLLGA